MVPVMEFGSMAIVVGAMFGAGVSASATSRALPLPLPALLPLSGGPAACSRGQGIEAA